jgi:cytoskeleton protein RodZ
MGSFGDRLRREREQRGVSLDDIALTTKIRAGLLQALEEEKFDRLPGGIFNKGFVRAYARHLGLDEDQAVADYLVASGEGPIRRAGEGSTGARTEAAEPRIQLVREEAEANASQGSPLGVRGLFAGLLVLVVVGAVAWFYYHRERHAENPSSPEPAAVSAPANPAASTNGPSVNAPSASPATGSSSTSESNSAPPQAAGPQNSVPSAAPSESKPASVGESSLPPGAFAVRLKADEECWVQIAADGKSEEVTLEAGLDKTVTAKNRVTVRAGNVGALEISFNGKKLPTQGDYGQVKTLVFGPDGLESAGIRPSTAAPTANP